MIEVARVILHQHGKEMPFADLTNAIQEYLGKSDEEIRESLAQFYTDLNIDGSFISLGDNQWALRSWYPYDSIDEALVRGEDEDEEAGAKTHHKRVNAFLAETDESDVIDYDSDDDADYATDDDDEHDHSADLKHYANDLDDLDDGDDHEDSLPDGIEGQLTELSDSDLADDDDEEN